MKNYVILTLLFMLFSFENMAQNRLRIGIDFSPFVEDSWQKIIDNDRLNYDDSDSFVGVKFASTIGLSTDLRIGKNWGITSGFRKNIRFTKNTRSFISELNDTENAIEIKHNGNYILNEIPIKFYYIFNTKKGKFGFNIGTVLNWMNADKMFESTQKTEWTKNGREYSNKSLVSTGLYSGGCAVTRLNIFNSAFEMGFFRELPTSLGTVQLGVSYQHVMTENIGYSFRNYYSVKENNNDLEGGYHASSFEKKGSHFKFDVRFFPSFTKKKS